jgi:NAD(P)-dependent dehydrogenase (short-subunit alcohol dehydrogenase family)
LSTKEEGMGRLEGRSVIVTGAGRGIGAAVARLLAAEGASVVVNDLGVAVDGTEPSEGPAHEVADEIVAKGGTAIANAADVADFAQAQGLIGAALQAFGKLDVLVNAAGILRDRMIFNMTEEEWDAVVRVHLKGTFNTTRHAAAYWREQRNPEGHYRIINFTSGSGLHGAPGQPNYAAAKMGIVGLTYSCANALGRYGVTANAIAPGAATRMTESIPEERRRGGLMASPDERAPENVAPVVAYLASVRSDWCTGQVLSARGYEIGLYCVPEVVRQVVSSGPFELDRAFELIERSFRPVVERVVPRPGAPAGPGAPGR